MSLRNQIVQLARGAKGASRVLANTTTREKNSALLRMAKALTREKSFIQRENKKDLRRAEAAHLPSALIDRLRLTDKALRAMEGSLKLIARLPDPVGEVFENSILRNGVRLKKVRVPLGVIAIIYESRPNVTSDTAGLCLKSGNAVVLKGGSEALFSNRAIVRVLKSCLKSERLPEAAISFIDTPSHQAVNILLEQSGLIDLVIPRGGEALIREVARRSKIPVIKHYKGVCHVFVDDPSDLKMAQRIVMNAKVQRPGVCNAMETLLVHEGIASRFLPKIAEALRTEGVELRGCPRTRRLVPWMKTVTEKDWTTEYLDLILSVRVVKDVSGAIDHISTYGSQHTDTIVTQNRDHARRFSREVDSACVFVNASTRLSDGGVFGMGAEMGISTDKLHARGPMGLVELTSYKYVGFGNGQIRT